MTNESPKIFSSMCSAYQISVNSIFKHIHTTSINTYALRHTAPTCTSNRQSRKRKEPPPLTPRPAHAHSTSK